MKFGAHLSIAKGLPALLNEAESLGMNAVQIFARNPRGRGETKIPAEDAKAFREELAKRGWTLVVHAPYYVNVGAGAERNRRIAIEVAIADLEKADFIGADYVVVHLGGPGDGVSQEQGVANTIKTVKEILAGTKSKAMLLLETSASIKRVGGRFEELAAILKGVGSPKRVGVCFDTCHVFTAGYDIRGKRIKGVLDEFDKVIGLARLKVVHCNDTESPLAGGWDRHFHIGKGEIGSETFRVLLKDKRLKDMNFLLETPKGDKKAAAGVKDADKMNMGALKSLAK